MPHLIFTSCVWIELDIHSSCYHRSAAKQKHVKRPSVARGNGQEESLRVSILLAHVEKLGHFVRWQV